MKLLRNYMKTCLTTAKKNNMCVRIIGDKTGLAKDIQDSVAALEEASKDNTGLHFQVAINYGSRDEMIRAVNHITEEELREQADFLQKYVGIDKIYLETYRDEFAKKAQQRKDLINKYLFDKEKVDTNLIKNIIELLML